MEGFTRGFYSISEWVMRFMCVNILWILFTLLGLGVFGFFPATTAMFAVVRKWVMKKHDIPVFKTFWHIFKGEFVKSNMIGLIITLFGLLLYTNIHIIDAITIPILKLLYIPNVILIIIFLLTLLYIFPVSVHYDVGTKEAIKNSLIFMTINPIQTFCMGTLTGFLLFIYRTFPGLIPFFSGSTIAFLLMLISINVFEKMNSIKLNSETGMGYLTGMQKEAKS
jgi:uncharacterized membrane protein YesL